MAEITEILKRYTEQGIVHGCSFVAVDANGNDIYRRAFGSRKVDRSEPLSTDTLTWIASQSKLVTSVAAMQLVERGLISLDDDVRPIVPELGKQKVLLGFENDDISTDIDFQAIARGGGNVDPEKIKPKGPPILKDVNGPITLRQLMSHSAGLAYDAGNPLLVKWSAQQGRTDNMFCGKIEGSTHPLTYQPGESWSYSPGLDWAGQVVEKLTKQDLETYMQENIWKPLNAKSMTFHPTKHFGERGTPPLHESALRIDGNKLSDKVAQSPWPLEVRDGIGGAGLYGTADDYALLLSCLLRGGQPLLKKESVDELFRPQLGKAANDAFRAFIILGGGRVFRASADDTSELMSLGHSLVGQVNLEDVPGRRKKGTVAWGGLPNLGWWIDRDTGIAGTMFNQVLPAGDVPIRELLVELEGAVYRLKEGANKH